MVARVKAKTVKPTKKAIGKKKVVAKLSTSKPKVKAKPKQPHGNHEFHPNHPLNVPTLTHSGSAVPHPDVARLDIQVDPGVRMLVFCTNVGSSGTLAWVMRWSPTTVFTNQPYCPQILTANGITGGPTAIRAMKASAMVLNSTQLLNRGGRVYTLNTDQRLLLPGLPSTYTAGNCDTIFDSIVQHPHTQPWDGTDFGVPRTHCATVVDTPSYERFEENDGQLSIDQFATHIGQWTGSAHKPRPMSTLVLALESPSAAQVYTLAWHGKWYTRWPLSTVAGRLQTPIPTASAQQLNALLAIAAARQHTMQVITS